jgi:hypothetical protein
LRRKNPDIHIDIHSHNTKGRNVRAKNPSGSSVAAHELFLFAVNDTGLYRQQIEPIIKNLHRKIAKGTYRADLALKLWKYAADTAAKRYTYPPHGTGAGYGIFTVPIRQETAKELAAHYSSLVLGKNPVRRLRGTLFSGGHTDKSASSNFRVDKKVSGKWKTVGYFSTADDAKRFATFAAHQNMKTYRVLELR